MGGSGGVGGNEKANRQPSCSLTLKLFLHHATQIFAQDDAFLLLAALRPPAARCNSLSFSFDPPLTSSCDEGLPVANQHQLLRCYSKLVLNEGPKLSRLVIKRTAVSELGEQYS